MLYTSLYVNQILLPSRQFRLHFPFKRKVRGCRNNRSLNSIVKNIEYDSKYHYSICLPLIPSQKNASLNWEINLYFVWIPCLSHHKKPKTPIIIGGLLRTRRYLLSPLRHCERSTAATHVETLGTRSVSAIMRRVEPEDLERTRCEGLFSSGETADCLPVFFFFIPSSFSAPHYGTAKTGNVLHHAEYTRKDTQTNTQTYTKEYTVHGADADAGPFKEGEPELARRLHTSARAGSSRRRNGSADAHLREEGSCEAWNLLPAAALHLRPAKKPCALIITAAAAAAAAKPSVLKQLSRLMVSSGHVTSPLCGAQGKQSSDWSARGNGEVWQAAAESGFTAEKPLQPRACDSRAWEV